MLKNKSIMIITLILVLIIASISIYYLYNNITGKENLTNKNNIENNIIKKEDKKEQKAIVRQPIIVVLNQNVFQETEEEQPEQQQKNNKQETLGTKTNNENTTDIINTNNNQTTNNINEVQKTTYYIKVNVTANVVNIYTKDDQGNYTLPYKAMVCSTGTATPQSGVYEIDYKYRWLSLIRRSIWTILHKNCWKYFISFCTIF